MPQDHCGFYGWPDPKVVRNARAALSASLIAKGLVAGTRKFSDVMASKWRRQYARICWGVA